MRPARTWRKDHRVATLSLLASYIGYMGAAASSHILKLGNLRSVEAGEVLRLVKALTGSLLHEKGLVHAPRHVDARGWLVKALKHVTCNEQRRLVNVPRHVNARGGVVKRR